MTPAEFTVKEILRHCNVRVTIIQMNLERQHQRSTGVLPRSIFLARFASAAPAIALPDKWKVAIMQSMLNEISNQFTRAEGARERREEGGGGVDEAEGGCIQHRDVAQHLPPDWCDAAQWGSGTYLDSNTDTPTSN